MILRFFLTALAVLTFNVAAYAQDMTIEEAYKAVPHARTPFDPGQSRIAADDAQYLGQLFAVTDLALRARIQALQYLYHNADTSVLKKYDAEIEDALSALSVAKTPAHLSQVRDMIISGIHDQQNFFHEWAALEGKPGFDEIKQGIPSHPLVQNAHQKLVSAYSMLKQLYPTESEHNQQAFFDHLCALDFI